MRKLRLLAYFLPLAATWTAAAQSWDTSGNSLLNGTYYFREVVWVVGDNNGDQVQAVAVFGNINFDGNGKYTISGSQINDSGSGAGPQNFNPPAGTYSIAANGYGFISSPVSSGDAIYGLVSNGVFVGSSTENTYVFNDVFMAAKLASPTPNVSFFQGAYSMAGVDFPYSATSQGLVGFVGDTRSSTFRLNPDGAGNIGTVSLSGYITSKGSTVVTQNISRVSYVFSNGAAVVDFGGTLSSSNLIAGKKYLYFSQDGNFVFGGSPNSWDFIIGVKVGSASTPNFNGLYYQTGVAQDNSQYAGAQFSNLETQFGAVNKLGPGGATLLAHQRFLSVFNNNTIDYTYSDAVTSNLDGTFDDSYNHYVFGVNGAIGIGIPKPPLLGVVALVQGPTFSGQGSAPYIFPTGILNAGSSAPFTASLAPGELVSIYGANFTTANTSDNNLPTTLGGVQVLVNGVAAPIYSVAHTGSYDQINAVIPMNTTASVASIQVSNNAGTSNTVSNYIGLTSPGIFNSVSATPAVQHADYSLVTSSSPVTVGETVLVYLTGLGAVDSSGKPTDTSLTAYVDGVQSTSVAAIGSQTGGGYQMNVTIPTGIHSGNVYLDIVGSDSYNSSAQIPIAAGNGTLVERPSEKVRRLTPRVLGKKLPRRKLPQ
jgi:uncharacterized protein (TIGR03437 family)